MTPQSSPETPAAGAALQIRAVEDADVAAVAALWRDCGLAVPHNPPGHDIAFCRATPTSELFVAELGGAIAATAMAGHDGHRGWLYDVAVDPKRRGEGLGRAIVARAESWLAEQGVRKVNLIIRDTNAAVQAFYERLGYDVEPRIQMARWLVDKPGA